MKKQLYFLVFLSLVFFFPSCMKEPDIFPATKDLQKINVSPEFDWSTGKLVELNIKGLPTVIPVFSTLTVSLEDGNILYQGRYEMSKNSVIKVAVPSQVNNLHIRYGNVGYSLPIVENKVNLSFIPEIQE